MPLCYQILPKILLDLTSDYLNEHCVDFSFILAFICKQIILASSSKKDMYNIKKFDGATFALWKEEIHNVLIYKKLIDSLFGQNQKKISDRG